MAVLSWLVGLKASKKAGRYAKKQAQAQYHAAQREYDALDDELKNQEAQFWQNLAARGWGTESTIHKDQWGAFQRGKERQLAAARENIRMARKGKKLAAAQYRASKFAGPLAFLDSVAASAAGTALLGAFD